MAGTNQAANLSGMLSQLAADVGKRGDAYAWTGQNIRDYSAPELDTNDPASMMKYADWAQRNGQQQLAIQMKAKAAARGRELKQVKAMSDMEALRGVIEANRDKLTPEQLTALQSRIAYLAQQGDLSPEQMASMGQRTDQRQDAANTQANTERSLGQVDTQISNKQFVDLQRLGLQEREIALAELTQEQRVDYQNKLLAFQERQRKDQVNQFAQSFDLRSEIADNQYNLGAWGLRQGDRRLDLAQERQIADIERMGILNDIDLRKATDMEIRTELFREYQADQISTNALKRIIMGDENARLNKLAPLQRDLLSTQIDVAAAQAGLTKEKTALLRQELGFNDDVAADRQRAIKLDNLFRETQIDQGRANIDLTEAQTEAVYWKEDWIEAQIDNIISTTNLNEDKFDWAKRQDEFTQRATLEGLKQSARRLDMEESKVGVWAANVMSQIGSRQFQDQLLAMNTMAQQVSPLLNVAMNADIDVTNPAAVANGRRMFIQQTGSPSAGAIYDEAMERRIATAKMQEDLTAARYNNENAKSPTKERLMQMGMPEERADQVMMLPGDKRYMAINQYIKQANADPNIAAPTEQMMEIYDPIARKLKSQIFGDGLRVLGLPFLATGIWDGVDDDAVWAAAKMAMARAAGSGMTDADVMLAGINAMMPFAIETGEMGRVQTVEALRAGLED